MPEGFYEDTVLFGCEWSEILQKLLLLSEITAKASAINNSLHFDIEVIFSLDK